MMWRWLAACALLMASALAFATGDAEQSASASAGAGAAMSGRFSEAPMLAARVAAGELPPVAERIPVDPVVQEMLGVGVGRYGGTLRVSEAVGFMNQRGGELTTQMLDIYLLSMHQETLDIVPNIAAGYAVADDGLTVTLELRPGTRWSNGDPFIVDDLMFVMEDMKWDDRVDPGWRACRDAHLPVRLQPDHPGCRAHRRPGGPASCSSWRSRSGRRSTCAWRRGWWTTPPGATTRTPTNSCCSRGGIDAITEFWNWINDGAGSGGVGLHGDFNMTGSYDEWEEARRLVERGERKLSDYGGELPGTEPPEEWKRYFDWQRQFRIGSAS